LSPPSCTLTQCHKIIVIKQRPNQQYALALRMPLP
jgi:hypothetical protein